MIASRMPSRARLRLRLPSPRTAARGSRRRAATLSVFGSSPDGAVVADAAGADEDARRRSARAVMAAARLRVARMRLSRSSALRCGVHRLSPIDAPARLMTASAPSMHAGPRPGLAVGLPADARDAGHAGARLVPRLARRQRRASARGRRALPRRTSPPAELPRNPVPPAMTISHRSIPDPIADPSIRIPSLPGPASLRTREASREPRTADPSLDGRAASEVCTIITIRLIFSNLRSV